MYISQLSLKNIRKIGYLTINLESSSMTNNSLLVLGDNGVGKSTILRALAIGLADPAGASGLLSDMYGGLIRQGKKEGSIEIVLNQGKTKYKLVTRITHSKLDHEIEEIKKDIPNNFPWSDLFVCAYGPHRAMHGTNSYEEYAIADAVYTLFNYEWELQNPELIARRRGWENTKRLSKLRGQIAEILMVRQSDVILSRTGFRIKSEQGDETNFGALSDGHRSTMNWVMDLIGWTYLSSQRFKEPSGIVLIDEIEQHLHPKWQRHIMRLLGEQFPDVQFIATSHSPFCAAGIYERKNKRHAVGEAIVLREDQGGEIVDEVLSSMTGMRYDKVLESAFGIPRWPHPLYEALESLRNAYRGPDSVNSADFKKALTVLRDISITEASHQEIRLKEEKLDQELKELMERKSVRESNK